MFVICYSLVIQASSLDEKAKGKYDFVVKPHYQCFSSQTAAHLFFFLAFVCRLIWS